jgi:heterotetrameric sarcosine oxidase gamma subunit
MVGSGPDEWFVIGDSDETAGDIGAELASRCTGFVSVIDLTHGRALVRLRGPAVRTVLPRLTAFDLDDRLVPNGAAWRTSLASLVVDLVRDDVDSHPSYLLHCERSSGRYLVDTILAAGADVGATLLAQPRSTWRTPSTSTTG